MLFARLALVAALAWSCAVAADYFVAPGGRPDAAGSRADPWDLATALAHPAAVRSGDTVWLAGGLYPLERTAVSMLVGSPDAPIVLRALPGERARLDCAPVSYTALPAPPCFEIHGAHAWYWGFEIFNSSPVRTVDESGAAGDPRGTGIHGRSGPGVKLINLIVHDVGTTLFESRPSGLEIYGLLAYNTGWEGPDRSHGPGLYLRNRSDWPPKTIEDSVVFQHFRQGLQGFGSTENVFSHVRLSGNAFFNNGIGRDGFHRNLMFGNGSDDHVGNAFESNFTYFSSGAGAGENRLGGDGGCRGLTLAGNVFAHGPGRTALALADCTNVIARGNLFYGAVEGPVPPIDNLRPNRPSGLLAFLRPDRYEPRRARLIVYNWDHRERILVDASGWGLPVSADIDVVSAQDPFAAPHRTRAVGGLLEIPMTGWSAARPIGLEEAELPPTLPEFGVFLLTWSPARALRSR